MASVSIRGVVPAAQACSEITAWDRPALELRPPTPSYPGQDLDPLYAIAPAYRHCVPAHRLCMGVVEDATVLVHPGYDGVVVTADGAAVRERTCYGRMSWEGRDTAEVEAQPAAATFDEAFVAFDSSWRIYYHWLVFCLGAAGVAQRVAPAGCRILVPDYDACTAGRPQGVSRAVFSQVSRVVDPARLVALPEGAHRVRRAHFLFVQDGEPSEAAHHPLLDAVFQSLKSPATTKARPERILVLRGGQGGAGRVTAADETAFERVADEYGLRGVRLERLAFQQQVDLFARAEIIVAPHGSGLANLVFAPRSAEVKLVELQTPIDGPGRLRPWFYVLAAAAGRAYALLDRSAGDFTAARLRQSLEALGVERRGAGARLMRAACARPARWLRRGLLALRARLSALRRRLPAPLRATP